MDQLIQTLVRLWRAEPTEENAQAVAGAVSRSVAAEPIVRKVIIAPGYGSGFGHSLAWINGKAAQFVVEHPALVEAVENERNIHEAATQVYAEVREKFPEAAEAVARALTRAESQELRVVEVKGAYRITEYDGAEGIESLDEVIDSYW